MVKKPNVKIKLKPTDNIGSLTAEDDEAFLQNCFYDSGVYQTLCNSKDNKFILLGRTGSGKTALINEINKTKYNVIKIDVSDLCLQYLGNSNIMKYISDLGVRIDPFYEMLWRYTFIIELINKRYNWQNGKPKLSTLEGLFDSRKRRGFELLTKLAPEFWESIDQRISYIIEKTEDQISASVGVNLKQISADISEQKKVGNEKKIEYKQKIEKVLGHDQFIALKEAVKILAEDVFNDNKNPYYIIIDDIDKDFAEENIRIKIIKALIDCIKSMRAIENVKFIIGMRTDLYEMIMDKSRDSGFQREKYDSCVINVNWSFETLFALIEKRINYLYASKYTKQDIGFYDLFCQEVNQEKTREYILTRTLMRPRDAISFVNECIYSADGAISISPKHIKAAEQKYSTIRYQALKDEWYSLHNTLEAYTDLIGELGAKFTYEKISTEHVLTFLYNIITSGKDDKYMDTYRAEFDKKTDNPTAAKLKWLDVMYKTGIIGAKENPHTAIKWSYKDYPILDIKKITPESKFYTHKMLWSYFGVKDTNFRE